MLTSAEKVDIRREHPKDIWAELLPLAAQNYAEVTAFPEIPFQARTELYETLDEMGALRLYTLRAGGELVGYCGVAVTVQAHTNQVCAREDVIYIAPPYRGHNAVRLIRFVDESLRAEGVNVVYRCTKAKHDHGAVLMRQGYKLIEHLYGRELKHA